MTGQENRALSERLALLADDAGMPGELVWEKHDQCDRLHAPFYYIKDDAVGTTGRYCGTCYQEYGNAFVNAIKAASVLLVELPL